MNILHYSLGFPPFRTGGLTKFCLDLMRQQIKEGHSVTLLWPGSISIIDKSVRILRHKSVQGIGSLEIINPVPVPYDEGINNIELFARERDKKFYMGLFKRLNPDVFHIHTFMGLDKGIVLAAKECGIKVVFSAHDFFPICPTVKLFRHGRVCRTADDCSECIKCNENALPLWKMVLLQSSLYRLLKESPIVRSLRKKHRDLYLSEGSDEDQIIYAAQFKDIEKYHILRKYYCSMINTADVIHFNSTLTENVYKSYLNISPKTVRIPIAHCDLKDNRRIRECGSKIRIGYLGSQSTSKGYYELKKAMDFLWKENKKYELHVYFKPEKGAPYIVEHPRYDYIELEKVFRDMDILIVPSVGYDTFGLVVIEAFSFGVPVVVSSHVGAKDVVGDGEGIIYSGTDYRAIAKALAGINARVIDEMNKKICEKRDIIGIETVSGEMCKLYTA